jgi:diadenylate cyclase
MSELFRQLSWWAVVDIALMAVIIYRLLLLIRGTRAMQMVLGILMLIGSAFILSQLYPLTTLKWVMDKLYSSILIILVILFQEDIRRVLSKMGKKPFLSPGESVSSNQIIDEIARAATNLSNMKIGALIVLERNIILNRYIDIGILLDGRISSEILMSIFHPSSPIHDGAVIIQQGKIAAAGCYLPLTRDESVDANLGTRHRAAIGISQETDALVIVVSEENAIISLVVDGTMKRNLDGQDLRKILRDYFSHSEVQADESESLTKPVQEFGAAGRVSMNGILGKLNHLKAGRKK